MRTAIYPGSFDPFTMGHLDILKRSARLFDSVVVAVLHNAEKRAMFTPDRRRAQIEAAVLADAMPNVRVVCYQGFLVDIARDIGACAIVRGIRDGADYGYEAQLSAVNRHLAPEIETIMISARPELAYISSSVVKELMRLGGSIDGLVPAAVIKNIAER